MATAAPAFRSVALLGGDKMSEDRLLVMSPERLTFATSLGGNVLVNIDHAHDLGLAPGIHLAMELSPNEARSIARTLLRKADEAEATIRTGYGRN
jgi:hypothetical protein